METTKIAVFKGKEIRRYWDDKQQNWYFSVVDVITALTDSENPAVYWRVLKKRLKDEGADQTVTKCNAFKMLIHNEREPVTFCHHPFNRDPRRMEKKGKLWIISLQCFVENRFGEPLNQMNGCSLS